MLSFPVLARCGERLKQASLSLLSSQPATATAATLSARLQVTNKLGSLYLSGEPANKYHSPRIDIMIRAASSLGRLQARSIGTESGARRLEKRASKQARGENKRPASLSLLAVHPPAAAAAERFAFLSSTRTPSNSSSRPLGSRQLQLALGPTRAATRNKQAKVASSRSSVARKRDRDRS